MDAEEQETLLLFVVAVVGVEHLADLPHDVAGLHGAGGSHIPSESEGAGLTVFNFPFLIPRYMATVGRKTRRRAWLRLAKKKLKSCWDCLQQIFHRSDFLFLLGAAVNETIKSNKAEVFLTVT